MRFRTAVAAFVAMTTAANAAFMDGHELHNQCQNNPSGATGFIIGVSDAVEMMHPEWRLCMPENVTGGQISDLVCNITRDHPEIRHLTANHITVGAISNAWGCAAPGY